MPLPAVQRQTRAERQRARGPEEHPLATNRDAASNERDADAIESVERDRRDQHGLKGEEALGSHQAEKAAPRGSPDQQHRQNA